MSAAGGPPVDTGAWLDGVRGKLKEHLAAKKTSQSALAKAVGCSASAISGFLGASYTGDSVGLARRIEDQLGLAVAREASGLAVLRKFVDTSISRAVWTVLDHCHVDCELGVVTGDAGLGKSMALTEYAARHPSATLIRAQTTAAAPIYFCRQLGNTLGVRVAQSNLFNAVQALMMHLTGTGRLIIIDEAQHLSAKALETVRDLHDETQCGFVLAGNGVVHELVHGTGTAEFAQHFSRLGAETTLSASMVAAEDVRALVAPDELLPAELQYLLRLARSRGGIRAMVKTYQLARRMESTADGVAFIDVLKTAHAMRYADHGAQKGE